MPTRFTPLVNEFYYHVYNRGVNKRHLFLNKKEYVRAMNLIKFYNYKDHPVRFSKFLLLSRDQRKEIWNRLDKSGQYVDIVSYCFMPNHFHLLVKQNSDNGISKLLANFQNSYSRYFNNKSHRVGHLFQGQFKAKRIDTEEQLLHVSRYIHLNPYTSALVKDINSLSQYKWSSFGEYSNTENFNICSKDLIKNYFANATSYVDFCKNNAEYQKSLEGIKHLTID